MPDFMLLLYSDPRAFDDVSPEDFQRVIERYRAWTERLKASGHFLASDKLTDGEGRVLRRHGDGVRVTDGPFTEAKEVVGGYYSVSADDYDAAVELARSCPHLDFGSIEVRQVDDLGPPPDAS